MQLQRYSMLADKHTDRPAHHNTLLPYQWHSKNSCPGFWTSTVTCKLHVLALVPVG